MSKWTWQEELPSSQALNMAISTGLCDQGLPVSDVKIFPGYHGILRELSSSWWSLKCQHSWLMWKWLLKNDRASQSENTAHTPGSFGIRLKYAKTNFVAQCARSNHCLAGWCMRGNRNYTGRCANCSEAYYLGPKTYYYNKGGLLLTTCNGVIEICRP